MIRSSLKSENSGEKTPLKRPMVRITDDRWSRFTKEEISGSTHTCRRTLLVRA